MQLENKVTLSPNDDKRFVICQKLSNFRLGALVNIYTILQHDDNKEMNELTKVLCNEIDVIFQLFK